MSLQRPHGLWQLAQRTCPTTFTSDPANGQLQLQPVSDNGTDVLSFDVPGTVSSSVPAAAVLTVCPLSNHSLSPVSR